ncbi:Sec-independent protein translocase protein TATA [Hibiscus syriacus]|uniref:Sec-independent protein translocase protein TATA n=1 Tax=Hibiscus syriacus TaxID=106335 RepID=A0A6A2XR06_HIBSY|nr:sec-independent protein translocase protein TATA, chloroplastic-like [Hibiscus syriacus]KAE8678971.1 Sec-independent protein translocase protein TATA [Hibiscus syriacus]
MEIFSITLSLSSPSAAAVASLPSSSSQSNFITGSNTISLLRRAKPQNKSVSFVVGRPRWRTTSEPAKKSLTCNALFGLGVPELVVIAGVAALVFGPKKLPEVGKTIGKTVKSFQQAAKEFESELKKEPESLSEQSEENSTAVSEEKKPDLEVSSSKESV